jgi:hypothetical protein
MLFFVTSGSHPIRVVEPPAPGRVRHGCCCRLLPLGFVAALVAGGGCVDLTKPWDKVAAVDGASDTAPWQTGGAAGAATGGAWSDGSVGSGGQSGAGGGVDGLLPEAAPPDIPPVATGGAAGSVAGLDGGEAQGGAGGGGNSGQGGIPGGPLDGAEEAAAGGAGGSSLADAAPDLSDSRPDASPADLAPDAPTDPPLDKPADAAADVAADTAPEAPADLPSDVAPDQISTVGLVAYYPCQGPGGASGNLLLDVSGNDNHGTLSVGPAPATGTGGTGGSSGPAFGFDTGKVGNGLTLYGSACGYVALPAGLLDGQHDVTIAAWIKVTSTTAFQRIFDFGSDTTNFMYLASANSANSGMRFRIVSAGAADGGVSQVIEGTQPIAVGAWTHVAFVLGAGGASIYVNGALQASSTDVTLRPADLGSTTAAFIGRSEFPKDPYLDGQIDEYRIYSRALSEQEIAALAGG